MRAGKIMKQRVEDMSKPQQVVSVEETQQVVFWMMRSMEQWDNAVNNHPLMIVIEQLLLL